MFFALHWSLFALHSSCCAGIVTAEGERWHGLRKQIAPTLKLEILEGVGMAAVRVTQRLFEDLDRACETGERVDMSEHFRRITLQVRPDLMLFRVWGLGLTRASPPHRSAGATRLDGVCLEVFRRCAAPGPRCSYTSRGGILKK